MKRVKQISIDILVDDNTDGISLAEGVADTLKGEQFVVLGSGFQDDMTEVYMKCYPNLISEVE